MHINRLVEHFMREFDMAPTTLGRLAASDPRLIFDMRNGREIGRDVEARLRRFMLAHAGGNTLQKRDAA